MILFSIIVLVGILNLYSIYRLYRFKIKYQLDVKDLKRLKNSSVINDNQQILGDYKKIRRIQILSVILLAIGIAYHFLINMI